MDPYAPPAPLVEHPAIRRQQRMAVWAEQVVQRLDQWPIECEGDLDARQARRVEDRLGSGARGVLRLRLLWAGRVGIAAAMIVVGLSLPLLVLRAVACTIAALILLYPILQHVPRPARWREVRLPCGPRHVLVCGGGLLVRCPQGTQWAIPWQATGDIRIVDEVLLWMPALPGSIAWALPLRWIDSAAERRMLRACAAGYRYLAAVPSTHPGCWTEPSAGAAPRGAPVQRLGPPPAGSSLPIDAAQFSNGLLWECQGLTVWLPGMKASGAGVTDPATGVLLPLPQAFKVMHRNESDSTLPLGESDAIDRRGRPAHGASGQPDPPLA